MELGGLGARLLDPPRGVGPLERPRLLEGLVQQEMQGTSLVAVDGNLDLAGGLLSPEESAGLHQCWMERALQKVLGAVPAKAENIMQECIHGADEASMTAGATHCCTLWLCAALR